MDTVVERINPGWGAAVWAGVTGALIGALGTLASGVMTYWSHQGDIDTKLIELSIGILQAEPKPETTSLREWAINTLQIRGKFNFAQNESNALLKNQLQVITSQIRSQILQQEDQKQQEKLLEQMMLMLMQQQQQQRQQQHSP